VSNLLKKEKGFTLIEIVLVLAIAGLLLVIVFLAVSGAQKSRRDTQRKTDAGRILAAVESCGSNNSGSYANCTTQAQLVGNYVTNLNDPTSGGVYTISAAAPGNNTTALVQVAAGAGNTCDGVANASTRVVVVRVSQEQGTPYCVDNK
jgi:prepilin-type N-terminal cleavage/methylation domain-containing protein